VTLLMSKLRQCDLADDGLIDWLVGWLVVILLMSKDKQSRA